MYVSVLYFVGIMFLRDYYFECMELVLIIVEGDLDFVVVFMEVGWMRELVEVFVVCSKVLVVVIGGVGWLVGVSNKKLREMGWLRDFWLVKL